MAIKKVKLLPFGLAVRDEKLFQWTSLMVVIRTTLFVLSCVPEANSWVVHGVGKDFTGLPP